ncbi:MAG: hypothetical protein COA78_12040 [Blastopirellula sp.]|nr:MAG: hypothetical protein COA78_12040 [Blastopirellula sp.]
MHLGKAVSMAITGTGLKYTQVAVKLDITPNYLYDIATSKKRPSLDLLIRLSELCEIKLSTLIQYGES